MHSDHTIQLMNKAMTDTNMQLDEHAIIQGQVLPG